MQKKVPKKKVAESVGAAEVPVVEQAPVAVAAPVKKDKKAPAPNTYIVLFKVAGHDSYRMNPFRTKEDLDIYLKTQPNHPVMTEKKWFIFDRINGTITLEK